MATRSTITELMVSGNDKVHKQTFYQADGGTELAQHLLFNNSICTTTSGGFEKTGTIDGNDIATLKGTILIKDLIFSEMLTADPFANISDTNRSFAYYPDATLSDTAPHTNFLNTSESVPIEGSPRQMDSGYELLGAGAPSGTARLYSVAAQHHGADNSKSRLMVRWRLDNFIISNAVKSDCKY